MYRAHDTRLHRDVTLKVLPDLFANDPERLARFERETRVLASLNHPNIAAVYGLEQSAGVSAIVMELVEGPTLAERTDIWAFGCVLFEMLTGRQTFEVGDTVSDAVAAILKNDPDWSALPADTPVHIRTLLRRCLQKDPQRRL